MWQSGWKPTNPYGVPGCPKPTKTAVHKTGSFGSLFFLGSGSLTQKRDGAPGEIRTPDLMVRSHALYPTELRALTGHLTGLPHKSFLILHPI